MLLIQASINTRDYTLSLLRSNTDAANLRCSKSIKIAKLLNAGLHHAAVLIKQQVYNTTQPLMLGKMIPCPSWRSHQK